MKIEILTNCPSCDSLLVRVKDQLFCKNISCPAKNQKQVANFSKTVKIKGLGEQTIKKLNLLSIEGIYKLTEEELINSIGEKLGKKLSLEIDKVCSMPLSLFLSACSIPLIGKTASEKVASEINDPKLITIKYCKEKGLGDKATNNLINWLDNIYPMLDIPIKFSSTYIKSINKGIKVCITGKIPGYTKAKLKEKLIEFNINIVDNLTKDTAYLLCAEKKNSTKEQKAVKLNIKIVTLEEIMEIVKND